MIHWCQCGRVASASIYKIYFCCAYCAQDKGHTDRCNKRQEKQ